MDYYICQNDLLQLPYTCGNFMFAQKTLHIKAKRCVPMTAGTHAVVQGSAMSGCQQWVLVGALVYGLTTLYPTRVIYKRKSSL